MELKSEGLVDRTTNFAVRPASALFHPVRQRLALSAMATATAFLLVLVCAAECSRSGQWTALAKSRSARRLGADRRDIVFMLIGENLRLFLCTALGGSALAAIAIQGLGPMLADGIGLPSALDPQRALAAVRHDCPCTAPCLVVLPPPNSPC